MPTDWNDHCNLYQKIIISCSIALCWSLDQGSVKYDLAHWFFLRAQNCAVEQQYLLDWRFAETQRTKSQKHRDRRLRCITDQQTTSLPPFDWINLPGLRWRFATGCGSTAVLRLIIKVNISHLNPIEGILSLWQIYFSEIKKGFLSFLFKLLLR